MVRATRRILSWARAERPISCIACFRSIAPGVGQVAARARIQGRDEHDLGRKRERGLRAADGDHTVLQRLAQHLQRVAVELRQLVEKEDAVMRQADLARRRHALRRRCRCLDCGQVRIDKEYA